MVMLVWAAANRDPEHFPEPDRCVLDRSPNDHVDVRPRHPPLHRDRPRPARDPRRGRGAARAHGVDRARGRAGAHDLHPPGRLVPPGPVRVKIAVDHPPDFDPLAPESFDSFHREFTELRERCPVAHSDAWNGFWALTRYEDVLAAAGDPELFTTTVQNVVPKLAFTGRRPPLHFDPPEHTPYRRALNPYFTAEKMEAIEPAVRRDHGRSARPARRRRRRRRLRRVHAPPAGLRPRRVLQPHAGARDGDPRGDSRVRRRGPAVRRRGREADEPRALRDRAGDDRDAARRATRPGGRPGQWVAGGARRRRAAPRGPAPRDDPPVHRRRNGRALRVHREHGRPSRREPRAAGAAALAIRRWSRPRSRSTCGCSPRTAASPARRRATSRSAVG